MIDIQALKQRPPASTSCQSADHQAEALNEAECCLNFHEAISTRVKEVGRPQLQIALAAIDEGDELVVVKLNQLERNQVAIARLHDLQEKGIYIRTPDGLINTRAIGKLTPVLLGLLSGLAEVEHSLARKKTLEHIQHRLKTGEKFGGRSKRNAAQENLMRRLRDEGCSYQPMRKQTELAVSTILRIIMRKEALAA